MKYDEASIEELSLIVRPPYYTRPNSEVELFTLYSDKFYLMKQKERDVTGCFYTYEPMALSSIYCTVITK
jgi:hypothetical protein